MSKNLNSRTIPEQAWKSEFFQLHFQYQKKNQNNSRNSRIIGHPGTLCLELHAPPPPPPSYMFCIPQLRVLSSYLRNSTPSLLPPPANKCKFEIFQSPISIEGVYTMHLMLPIYVEYFWSSSLLSCNKDSEGFSK